MAGLNKMLKKAVRRRERASARDCSLALEVGATLESSPSESCSPFSLSSSSISSSDGEVTSPKRMKTRETKKVLSSDLVGTFGRRSVSRRQAFRIVAATVNSLGYHPKELILNRSPSVNKEQNAGPLWRGKPSSSRDLRLPHNIIHW